jgi:hypothetical protein
VADRRIDRTAVVFGAFFVLVGVAYLLDRLDVWTVRSKYLPPVVLIALGVAVLLGIRRSPPGR